jgi:hypothetical protein
MHHQGSLRASFLNPSKTRQLKSRATVNKRKEDACLLLYCALFESKVRGAISETRSFPTEVPRSFVLSVVLDWPHYSD